LRQWHRMRRAGDVGLMDLSINWPVPTLLNVFQCSAVGFLSHTLRKLYRRALLLLANTSELCLRQWFTMLIVITLIFVSPCAIAMYWAGGFVLIWQLCAALLLLLHPAVSLLSVTKLCWRSLWASATVVDLTMRSTGMNTIVDLQAERCGRLLSLLLTALKVCRKRIH